MKTILFQGDSITDCGRARKEADNIFLKSYYKMTKKTPMGNGYPALISSELKGEYSFINRGVGGDRILDVYARIVRDIIKLKPDYMSILVGVNDVWHGFDWNNGTEIWRYKKVYNILLEELAAELPEMKIMIMEPFILKGTATADRQDQPDRYSQFRKSIDEVAEISKKLADKHDLKFIPLQKIFDEEAKNVPAEALLSDGVHPTEKGHELIKTEWLKAFNEIK